MTSDPETIDSEDDLEASPFGQFLFSQRDGKTHTELSQAIAEVSKAVLATGGTGTITLKITVSPLGHENRLVVKDDVLVKPPKPIRDSSIWFYNESQRGLSRNNPTQGELDLAVIPMRPRAGAAIAADRNNTCA